MQAPEYAGLPKKERYTDEELEKVRDNHNKASAEMIKDYVSSSKPKFSLRLENCKERYPDYIAIVVE